MFASVKSFPATVRSPIFPITRLLAANPTINLPHPTEGGLPASDTKMLPWPFSLGFQSHGLR